MQVTYVPILLLGGWSLLSNLTGRPASAGRLPSATLTAPPHQQSEAQAPALTQVQVARGFLLAMTHGQWATAYGQLAPEVRAGVSAEQFRVAAQPLYQQAQRYGSAISLYKLGYRLRDAQTPQPFVAFSFKADTLQAYPHFQLDVTFRDSTARQVLGFGLVPLAAPVK
ncbi:hypothetical protein [Hymenobacter sp. AT01-02]|uniref:hypothetical protein n=1 Tax=Hymenobacter sp. AT01-02 TaxID=1571877 RepID=UPI0005F21F12|nr:hypothetical protein [Hymenobacter sp. AT01-02]